MSDPVIEILGCRDHNKTPEGKKQYLLNTYAKSFCVVYMKYTQVL